MEASCLHLIFFSSTFRNTTKVCIICGITTALTVGIGANAALGGTNANNTSNLSHNSSSYDTFRDEVTVDSLVRAIEILEPTVYRRPDGTFVVPPSKAQEAGLDEYKVILRSVHKVNEEIAARRLESFDDLSTRIITKDNSNNDVIDGRITGVTGVEGKWFGYVIRLNASDTEDVIDAIGLGAGAAALAALFPPAALPASVTAAVGGFSVAALNACSDGNGINIYYTYFVPEGPPVYCKSQ